MRISKATLISLVALLAIRVGIPLALVTHEAGRTGQTVMQYLKRAMSKSGAAKPLASPETTTTGKKSIFSKADPSATPWGIQSPGLRI